jgi:nucleotide-binding universal stress UspA family protein
MSRPLALLSLSVALLALGGAAGARPDGLLPQSGETTEVVVALTASPLAYASVGRTAAARTLRDEQRRFRRALRATIPTATLRWRYELVQNGYAVVLPASELPRLAGLPGVRRIYPSGRYAPLAGPAGAAIDWACDEANLHRAGILVIHSRERDISRAEAGCVLDLAVNECRQRTGVCVRGQLTEGSPASALVEASRTADIVAIGSRGRSGFKTAVFGSVALSVAGSAWCTVAVTHPRLRLD